MKHQKKFTSREQQQISETQSRQTASREFASVEELLRFDAKQTKVPPEVARRLNQTLRNEPGPARPFWRRWFSSE